MNTEARETPTQCSETPADNCRQRGNRHPERENRCTANAIYAMDQRDRQNALPITTLTLPMHLPVVGALTEGVCVIASACNGETCAGSSRLTQREQRLPTNEWVARARPSSGPIVSHDHMTVCRLANPSVCPTKTRCTARNATGFDEPKRRMPLTTQSLEEPVSKKRERSPRHLTGSPYTSGCTSTARR